MNETTLRIEGMSCGHCVGQVRKALAGIDGLQIQEVKVGQATVTYDPNLIELAEIVEAVKEAGYEALPVGRAA
jgi:copper chaperone